MRRSVVALLLCVFFAGTSLSIPNPSATYCIECGYRYETRTDDHGGQYSVCVFPDGSECEPWAFWRKCNAPQSCNGDCNCPWPCPARIIYVDDDAAGANDGTSWQNAYRYLQDALMMAREGDEIHVAQGIYRPDDFILSVRPSRGRAETFQLKNGVILKGGYAGLGQRDPNVRDVDKHRTILSGDLDANDVNPTEAEWQKLDARPDLEWQTIDDLIRWGSRKDNSYSVVTGSGTDQTAILDGFTITAGQADGEDGSWDGPQVNGAGMYNHHGSPTVSNCIFLRNTTCGYGGQTHGAGLFNSDSSPVLRNCRFIENITFGANSTARGGGMFDVNSAPILTNCVFRNNIVTGFDSDYYGGAAYDCNSRSTFVNCSFIHNCGEGGAMQLVCSHLKLANCTFAGNRTAVSGDYWGCGQPRTSSLEVVNCIIWDNVGEMPSWFEIRITYSDVRGGWAGCGNISDDPCFAQAGYWDNNATPDEPWDDFWVEGGDYHLKSQAGRWDPKSETWVKDDVTSPCIDAGDPMSPIGQEAFPNGGRINMGAYGGTAQASKSYFGAPVCEMIVAGDINGDCIVDFADFEIMASHWLEDDAPINSNFVVRDGVRYHVATDKGVYNLGENVEIIYRVTNLTDDPADIGEVPNCEYCHYDVSITQDGNADIWDNCRIIPPCGITVFHLAGRQSKEYRINWATTNDNGTLQGDDDYPVGPGRYNITAELRLYSPNTHKRVAVSVSVEIRR